jgi:hypothetical protein
LAQTQNQLLSALEQRETLDQQLASAQQAKDDAVQQALDSAREQLATVFANVQEVDQETGNLLDSWVQVGRTILQKGPFDTPPTPGETRLHAENLVKALSASILLARGGTLHGSMSPPPGKQPAGSGMFQGQLTAADCKVIWNALPAEYRHLQEGENAPSTSVELIAMLMNNVRCFHVEENHDDLGDLAQGLDWEVNREVVRGLAGHECPAHQVSTTRSTLFKASEVPKFTNTKEYDDYRSSLLMFFQSTETPARHEFGTALLRILSTFEDPTAKQAAKGWNVRPLCHTSSWEITYRQFLAALDDKFQSATLLQDTKIEWMKCRPRENERPTDFFNRFEALTTQLQDVQARLGAPELSPTVVSERLLLVLPRYLTDDARQNVARTGEMLELKSPKELRKYFEISWTYLPKPAATGHNTKANYQTGNTRAAPVAQGGNEPRQRKCGLFNSYETSPAVPHALRGSLYPDPKNPDRDAANLARHADCLRQNLCQSCRRPRNQHPVGTNFQEIKPLRGNVRQAAVTQAPLVPEDHRLEAAPTTA